MINIKNFKEVEVRQFKRVNRLTGREDIVEVSNRNGFTLEEHIRLLNMNDRDYKYSMI